MYTHVRHIRQHDTLQILRHKNATRENNQKRFPTSSSQMRELQKSNYPSGRLKRVWRFPKSEKEKIQSKTPIRRKQLRRFNPKGNHRLHERTRKGNERDGKPLHGRIRQTLTKLQILKIKW